MRYFLFTVTPLCFMLIIQRKKGDAQEDVNKTARVCVLFYQAFQILKDKVVFAECIVALVVLKILDIRCDSFFK